MAANPNSEPFSIERSTMVQQQLARRGIRDELVLRAMGTVPREAFLVERYQDQAYEDHPVPIPLGQTVSQPYIVALMIEAASIRPGDKVLEVGTGTGYQSAVLAAMGARVITIERHAELAALARVNLELTGYGSVSVVTGDGAEGYPAESPFKAIIVAAAAPAFPPALFSQLAEGGRLVIPVGPPEGQDLQLVKNVNGVEQVSSLGACSFVPLIGRSAYGAPRL